MSEELEGFFRSPRSIQGANGPHEVQYVPLASSLAAALLDGLSEQPANAFERVCKYPGLTFPSCSSSLSTPF